MTEGTNRLVPDPAELFDLAVAARRPASAPRPEGWDGHAAERIVSAFRSYGSAGNATRPSGRPWASQTRPMSALRPVSQPVIAVLRGTASHALLVTYHFPPDTAVGGIGGTAYRRPRGSRLGRRRHLARSRTRPGMDETRLQGLTDNVTVVSARRSASRSSARAGRFAFGLTALHAAADAAEGARRGGLAQQLAWAETARASARSDGHIAKQTQWAGEASARNALASRDAYDVVASSGPPHMAHEAARLTSSRGGRPLVIDLRDPWGGWKGVPGVARADYASRCGSGMPNDSSGASSATRAW